MTAGPVAIEDGTRPDKGARQAATAGQAGPTDPRVPAAPVHHARDVMSGLANGARAARIVGATIAPDSAATVLPAAAAAMSGLGSAATARPAAAAATIDPASAATTGPHSAATVPALVRNGLPTGNSRAMPPSPTGRHASQSRGAPNCPMSGR
jgi:hypothetical protein